MNSQIFSKAYLRGIPEQRKQEYIDILINQHLHDIKEAAAQGKTSYMYKPITGGPVKRVSLPVITNDDLISAFKRKFPDCIVTYEENWVDVDSQNKVLKKGILIDWS
jgi:hypothetical protein